MFPPGSPDTPPILAKFGLPERTVLESGISGVGILGTGAAGPEVWCRFDTPDIGVVLLDPIPLTTAMDSLAADSRK